MRTRGFALFIVRRLAALVVLVLIISFVVFSLLYLAPGSTERALLGNRPATPETLNNIRERFHLNDPFFTQYRIWLEGAVRFDFGESIRTGETVRAGIANRMRLTAFLGLFAFAITMMVGVPLGVLSAVRRRTTVDRSIVGLTVIAVSAPAFVTGLFLLYFFAVKLRWFPAFGQGEGFGDRLWHLSLPAIALALSAMALVVRLTRAGMVQALEQDYVTFARARGLSNYRVLVAYALRNALIPVVTAGGAILGLTLTAAVVVEVTFALPGIGALFVDSINFKDIPMVQGVAMTLAAVVIFINLLTDVIYLLVDPRIQFGQAVG